MSLIQLYGGSPRTTTELTPYQFRKLVERVIEDCIKKVEHHRGSDPAKPLRDWLKRERNIKVAPDESEKQVEVPRKEGGFFRGIYI